MRSLPNRLQPCCWPVAHRGLHGREVSVTPRCHARVTIAYAVRHTVKTDLASAVGRLAGAPRSSYPEAAPPAYGARASLLTLVLASVLVLMMVLMLTSVLQSVHWCMLRRVP